MYLVAVPHIAFAGAPTPSRMLLLAVALSSPAAFAQYSEGSGTAAMPAIAAVPSARPSGMAGAVTALELGSQSVGSNPAGLAREQGTVYSGSVRPDMTRLGAVSVAFPAFGGRVAVGAGYADYDAIPAVDENNVGQGTLRPFSLYPSATYARTLGAQWRWGATVKLARETLGDFEGSTAALGAGFDAGVQYQPSARGPGFGASVTNVGRRFSGYFEGDDSRGALPGAARAGITYQPPRNRQLLLAADLELPFHDAPALALGGEYRVLPEWGLRAGTRWNRDDFRNLAGWLDPNAGIDERGGEALKLAGGTSVRVGPVSVDYAAQWWRELGLVHALTVSWEMMP
jgi:hypothetical protein